MEVKYLLLSGILWKYQMNEDNTVTIYENCCKKRASIGAGTIVLKNVANTCKII